MSCLERERGSGRRIREIVATTDFKGLPALEEIDCHFLVGCVDFRTGHLVGDAPYKHAATQTPNAAVLAAMDGFAGDGLSLPIDAEFAGVEPCPICYAVIHPVDHQKPRLRCRQCSNTFHATCLYTWFRTSSKSSCPLCVTPWGSSYR